MPEEAQVKEEITLVKPKFEGEIKAEIKTIGEVEDNIQEVKEYALKLKDYYSEIVFDEESKKDAETEKAEVNKQKAQVEKFRKEIVAKYKEPIDLFEKTAKEAEKILGETYEIINQQVKVFDEKELEKVREKVESYFNEYAQSKGIDFVSFDKMNISITKGLLTATDNLTKKVQDQITEFIDRIVSSVNRINGLEFKNEIMIEYKKTLNDGDAIATVYDRHKQLEEAQKQPLTDEKVQEQISHVTAPKIDEPKIKMTFTVIGTRTELKQIKDFLDNGGYRYE